jgi:hypothetical protein
MGEMTFNNHGIPCTLHGYQAVRLLGPDRRALAIQVIHASAHGNDLFGPPITNPSPVILGPTAHAAYFQMKWMNWCNAPLARVIVEVEMHDGPVDATVPVGNEMPQCDGAGSFLRIGPVY